MKESRVSWATVTATASVVIAACALALSIWQGQLGRLQSRVAARPILVFNTRSATEGSFRGIEIGNFGQGAAFVRGFHVYVDHQLVPGQGEAIWKTASQRLEPGSSNLGPGATLYWQYWQPGTVIPAKS
jgi:hypothetical protein